jgi:hypothetical protein
VALLRRATASGRAVGQPEHGIADDAAMRQAQHAVDSRAFPLFTYDPRRGERESERWSLQGNPALRDDWAKLPDGSVDDFLAFRPDRRPLRRALQDRWLPDARDPGHEGRAAKDWHTFRELAGLH